MKKPDLLCFSSTDWDGLWGSRQQVMLRFARRGYRVLFIEQLAGWEHLWRYPQLRQRKRRLFPQGLRPLAENLWALNPPPLLPGRYLLSPINRWNCRKIARWLQPYLQNLHFSQPVLWVYKPEHVGLFGRFGEPLRVYHCIDEWTAGVGALRRAGIRRLENQLLAQADLVFANSSLTYAAKERLVAALTSSRDRKPSVVRVPSGADCEHFAAALRPELPEHPALQGIPHPRIGYSGTINERLDYAFLQHLAEARPDWQLVMIGDPYPWTLSAPPLQRLRKLPNVHFLGRFPFAEMPALLKGLDIGLLPYVGDDRGRFRSPLKLYEYLAAGKAVVSTPHPDVQEVPGAICIGHTPIEFIAHIERLLAEETPDRRSLRIALAGQNSWEARVTLMEQHLLACWHHTLPAEEP